MSHKFPGWTVRYKNVDQAEINRRMAECLKHTKFIPPSEAVMDFKDFDKWWAEYQTYYPWSVFMGSPRDCLDLIAESMGGPNDPDDTVLEDAD